MGRGPLAIVVVVAVTLLNPATSIKFDSSDEDVVVSAHLAKINHNSHHVSKEWIQAPNGFLYQFHSGYQTWLAAREFCLSQNSDLVTLRDKEQINWLLSHYAPTYPRFSERFVQIGLLLPDGASHNWTYVNGSKYDRSLIPWISGEPFDHSVDGKERCGLLRVHSRLLDDVDCELASRSRVRFICERDSEIHKQQQRSGNYLWRKVEQLMKYFRVWTATGVGKESTKNTSEEDYSDKPSKTVEFRRSEKEDGLELLEASPYARLQTSSEATTEERVLEKTTESSSNETRDAEEVVTEQAIVPDTTIDTEIGISGKVESTRIVKHSSAHAAPLREIAADEGSGVEVGPSDLEDSAKHYHEIEPEKLEQIINTMEKMLEKLENISFVEKKNEEKAKPVLLESATTESAKQSKDEEKQKQEQREKVLPRESLVGISEKQKADRETLLEMEEDFDEDLNKNMPTTDIRPENDEDCDDEASGEKSTDDKAILGNGIDTEDVDNLSQKPKIPVEREEHVEEFLHTLRTFLNRAEHSDLRKLLDNNSGKTLLEKMKLAIAEANEREFNRLKELEVMKKNGIDVSNVPDPIRMPDTVREELFRKIRGVVIAEAEKVDLKKAIESLARTTTEETLRTNVMMKHKKNPEDVEMRSASGTSRGKMSEKKTITEKGGKEAMFVGNRGQMGEQGERPREVDTKSVKVSAEREVKKEANVESTEEKIPLENTQEKQQKSADDENTPVRAEAPTRTVQLKEFDDRNEIMSGESETVQKKENDEKTGPVKKVRDLPKANESVDINWMSLKSEEQEKTEEQNVPREGNNRPSEDHGMSSKQDEKSQDHEGGQLITASSEVRDHDSEEKVVTEIAIVDINAGKEKNDKNDSEEEVGTERAPVDNDGESKQEINEKEMIRKVAPEEHKSDINNPLGLPTLPPPPTLPPLPTLKELFDNLTKEWKKLFKHPKSLFKL